MNTSKRYFLSFIVVAIAASLSSCSSNPTSSNINSPIPAPVTTPSSTLAPEPITTPSITSSPEPITTPSRASSPTPSQIPSVAQLRDKSTNTEPPSENTPSPSKAATSKTTNATIYTSDVQCQKLLPQKVSVTAEEPVKSAVGKILDKRDTSDFSVSGYRINVKNGIATVDLRISPESKRQIASLSSCEQFALFGSLRKTLTDNAQWNIKDVRFTSRGEEIVF